MPRPIPGLMLLLALACVPRPPVYVRTASPAERLASLKEARFLVQSMAQVDVEEFKRSFEKRYGSKEAFIEGFRKDLIARLEAGAASEAPAYRLELPSLRVTNDVVSWTVMRGGGPMGGPPMMETHSTEFCVIRLAYRVVDAAGAPVLEGTVEERTAKAEFLHPHQSKLANAVEGVQTHLVEYLRGRLPGEHVAPPETR